MTKVRGRPSKHKVKRSSGVYTYFEIKLPPDLPKNVKKLLEEQDELIFDLSDPFAKRKTRRSKRNK